MRIIFAGTPEVAVPTLKLLVERGHEVVAVLTRPDAPQGRKKILTPSPVADFATRHNIPLIHAAKITPEATEEIRGLRAELGVVVAYGALIPSETLGAIPHGWINLHFSALPQWRGAAPAQWQVLTGCQSAGSSVFSLVPELDAGDIFDVQTHPIDPDETSGELLSRLAVLGAEQVVSVVSAIESGEANARAQEGLVSHARKLTSDDGHLDISQPVDIVYNQFRGVSPEPGAYVVLDEQRFKIITARMAPQAEVEQGTIVVRNKEVLLGCARGALILKTVQPFGKPQMDAADWFRGTRLESVSVS